MNIHKQVKIAEEMGIDRAFAVRCRQRYLSGELMRLDSEIHNFYRWDYKTAIDIEFLAAIIIGRENDRDRILKELDQIKRIAKPSSGGITDEDIERARQYPVERLIEFTRKKAVAWCHCDTNPSLCHMDRINKVWCPVCNKYFDSIGVLMDRDGTSFIDAVKELS